MKLKSKALQAAAAASLISATCWAAEPVIIFESNHESHVMCVPIWSMDGKVEIMSLCDAKGLNAKSKVATDENGCALPGQNLEADGNGSLYDQAAYTVWREKGSKEKELVECSKDEAAVYWIEL